MKKTLTFIGALFLTAIPAYSQTSPTLLDTLSKPEPSNEKVSHQDAFKICSKETDYNTLYDYGKELANGWIYYKKKGNPAAVSQTKRGTKDTMFSSAFIGLLLSHKYSAKDVGKNVLIGCWMGYNKIREKQPLTAIHIGFMEHLPQTDKSLFVSLPQR